MQAQVKQRCETKALRLGHNLLPGHRAIEAHPEPLHCIGIAQSSQRPIPDDVGYDPPLTLR
jgi:hypothetical protein